MVNKKYAGFTMLECLVALVVLSCMCQLFQLMIQQSFIGNQYLKNNDSKSWHIFLIQLEKECQKLVFQTGSAQEISFLDSETNKTISIQIKEDKDGKLIWVCPNCGNTNQDKMSVARRTCGYIGTQFWNQGRTQEIKERVLHL